MRVATLAAIIVLLTTPVARAEEWADDAPGKCELFCLGGLVTCVLLIQSPYCVPAFAGCVYGCGYRS